MSSSGTATLPADSTPSTGAAAEVTQNPSNDIASKEEALTFSNQSNYGTVKQDTVQTKQKKKTKNMEETSLQFLNSKQNGSDLSNIKTTRDLDQNSIRNVLRKHTGDDSLEIVSLSPLEDMSGMNDAFNSSICSLSCVAKYRKKSDTRSPISEQESDNTPQEEEFNFVVKCPPTAKFIQFAHKFTKPFCNEVSWYLDLVHQLQLTQPPGTPPVLGDTLPVCYHAVSSYHNLEIGGNGDEGLSSCW